ncbi:hypothetical protein APSETT444_000327 [Aspergillus pseudonomiae]
MAQDVGNDALPILHASIRANLHLESSLAKERLAKALNLAEKRYHHAFAVKALQLEILSREGHSNGNEYLQSFNVYDKPQVLRDMLDILNPNKAELNTFLEGKYIASLFTAAGCLVSAQLGKMGKVKEDDELLAQVIHVLEAGTLVRFQASGTTTGPLDAGVLLLFSYALCEIMTLGSQFTDLQRKITTCEKQSSLWQHYLHCDINKAFRAIAEARKETEPSLKACLALFPIYQVIVF